MLNPSLRVHSTINLRLADTDTCLALLQVQGKGERGVAYRTRRVCDSAYDSQ